MRRLVHPSAGLPRALETSSSLAAKSGAAGFTLIEVLVAIAIMAMFTTMIALPTVRHIREARVTAAQAQIGNFESALRSYNLDNGRYPTSEQGLIALIVAPATAPLPAHYRAGGYWERDFIPKDPWGGEFQYLSPGVHGEIDVWSFGSDGQPGGDGDAADLGNWDLGRR